MATETLMPKEEIVFEDKRGISYRLMTVHVPQISVNHEMQTGEKTPTSSVQVSGPSGGTATLTTPAGTSLTGGLDGDDLNLKVKVNADVVGDYTILVRHAGRAGSGQ